MLIKKYEEGEMYAKLVLDEIALHLGMALVNICAVRTRKQSSCQAGSAQNLGGLFRRKWRKCSATTCLLHQSSFFPKWTITKP